MWRNREKWQLMGGSGAKEYCSDCLRHLAKWHLSSKTTQIYAEVTRTKINEDMTNHAGRIQGENELTK
ncbi:MAG: hypothetical protein ACLTWE_01905 [Dysgonomonas mossii]|nr:hypothetical protein [Dysgonomonas mossii]